MRTPKRKLNGKADIAGGIKPSALQLVIIRQFAKCFYVERDLNIPDNTFLIN